MKKRIKITWDDGMWLTETGEYLASSEVREMVRQGFKFDIHTY